MLRKAIKLGALASPLIIAPSAFATTPTAADLVDPFVEAAFTNAPVGIAAMGVLVIAVWMFKKAWRKFNGSAPA